MLARVRERIEPDLPTRRALLGVIAIMAVAALALQLLSKALTDDDDVQAHLVAGLNQGQVFALDNPQSGNARFSECMSASILLREANKPDLRATLIMEALEWDGRTPLCQSLLGAARNEGSVAWSSYSRYWHGNLVPQRLWLDRWDYESLTVACHALALAMLTAFGLALAWRVSVPAALVTVGLGYLLSDVGPASFLPSQGISLAALFGGVAAFTALPRRWTGEALILAAFAVGAAYNYFDFLYNPGLMAGLLGWVMLLKASESETPRDLARRAGGVTLMALTGFVAMWAAKWALCGAYMLATFDFFNILGPSNATHWALGGETSVWPLQATLILTQAAFTAWWSGPAAIAAIAAALGFAWRRGVLGRLWLPALPLSLTLLTLELASGHSVSHGFTCRAIPFVVAAFCGGAVALAERGKRATAPAERPARTGLMSETVSASAGD